MTLLGKIRRRGRETDLDTDYLPYHPAGRSFTGEDVVELSCHGSRITSVGPRYCTSVEDKIVRFADRPRHQIFIEPERPSTHRRDIPQLPTSLPREAQRAMIDSIDGLAGAEILRPGYAIEYDFV